MIKKGVQRKLPWILWVRNPHNLIPNFRILERVRSSSPLSFSQLRCALRRASCCFVFLRVESHVWVVGTQKLLCSAQARSQKETSSPPPHSRDYPTRPWTAGLDRVSHLPLCPQTPHPPSRAGGATRTPRRVSPPTQRVGSQPLPPHSPVKLRSAAHAFASCPFVPWRNPT